VAPDVLLVFLKDPRPGTVKTRLAAELGGEAAAELYRVLAEEELRRTAPHPGEYDRLLSFSPPESRSRVERWLPGETWIPQDGADLGTRMSGAFEEAFRRGARQAVLVGSDVPSASREHVLDALGSLRDHDVVLGPALDGGYYLVGLARPRPELFRDMTWSTASVFATTVARAGALGLRVRVLESLRDIDTLEDVHAEWGLLRPLLARRPALLAAVERALARYRAPGGRNPDRSR
jgi:rSAM/selenodomain-associated transferase 1